MVVDPASLLQHWGYAAVFAVVILGNIGLPVPEESVLLLAGYLVWDGQLSLFWVLTVGIAAAVIGDGLGYWLGRRIGPALFERHGPLVGLTPDRLRRLQDFVCRRGAFGVFVARFLPGLRAAAGPVAGMLGVPFTTFAIANVAGAFAYVPLAVAVGYGFSTAVGAVLARFERSVAPVEHVFVALLILAPIAIALWRWARSGPR
jgi:membrane protein DedA with SNARE-associated domain